MDVQTKMKSMEIEFFIKQTLNVKHGSKADMDLHNMFDGMFNSEAGYSFITPAMQRSIMKKANRYLVKTIDQLAKKKPIVAINSRLLKEQLEYSDSSVGFLTVYERLKVLVGAR